ncbi:hypothetical protein NRB20_37720 [Nocardia sp. RB20]|uniref:DUF1707 domain-containing protein n=2 Tax=Nocardia macrotermitis TaxID=2585198 RepID=A0A7K0D737_9NOCA|nr:hypothetical protein [Nocardia macrotermitis]
MAGTALDNAYADGELDNAEYHVRLEATGKAKTRGELYGLLDDLQVPHALSDLPPEPVAATPAPPSPRTNRGRIIAGVAIAVVVCVFAIVMMLLPDGGTTPRRSANASYTPGTVAASASPRANFTPDDAALMQHLPTGYDQSDCYHKDPQQGEAAALHCDPYSGHLEAAFFLYPDAETLQQGYDEDRRSAAHTACADGALDNPYAAGRYECTMSNGTAVVPTLEWPRPSRMSSASTSPPAPTVRRAC